MMNCTVIIYTYNRPDHIKRILNYYYQYGRDVPVVVADSSSIENKKLNRETVSSFQGASFQYLDKYDQNILPIAKVLDAIGSVSTEYCVLCADDDFIIPSGIQQSVMFLDNNPDYVAAYGRTETFLFEPARGGGLKLILLKHKGLSCTCTEPKGRLVQGLGSYDGASFFYAVRHTGFMKMAYSEAVNTGCNNFITELLLVGLPAIYGKMKCLETLFSVREICTPAHMTAIYPTIREIKRDKSYTDNKREFYECLATHLSKQAGIGRDESYKAIDEAMALFTKTTTPFMFRVSRRLSLLKLPSWLDHGIRKLYRSMVPVHSSPEDGYALTSQYDIDSNIIRQCILSSVKEVYGLER